MQLRVLGCAGAEFPNFRPPAFLIDGCLLLDAGTVGAVLDENEQWQIRSIFITHAHLDHIRGIPALADNIIVKNMRHLVTVYATDSVVCAMRDHLLNGLIWPDFTLLPSPENPVLKFQAIAEGESILLGQSTENRRQADGYTLTSIGVNHTVPAVGYIVQHEGKTLAYTGDTGPTEEFWKHVSGVDAMIVEVSFPDSMESLALLTKHLTSSLLKVELAKIDKLPKRILITHPKPQYFDLIRSEVESLGIDEIELLHDGALYTL